ncbi:Beta-glucoside kinase [Paraliobacillus sp. PM-2]|uniref:ROK family protein n=1 Tax=Paraliobacillus sp. PM-2 TaxID=1462524 RepID=UPI00061C1E58|nr:ROK family protein [Paraliobacillus sp. PM-2]CQR47366.1 Beta-glucoside kinase [Paraliobacillus sp. PM-2]
MLIAVFDIGGTSIKYGVSDDNGNFLFQDSYPTKASQGGKAIIDKLIATNLELKDNWEIEGITISSAGQIDNKNGVVVYATDNIPGYTGMEISKNIGSATGLPVKVENDVNCTALGEYWKGAAKNVENFICVTIGTGIGGAIFINGQLFTGSRFSAGEIGHINLYPNGKACTCGNRGCFERYASSLALEEMVNDAFHEKKDLKLFFDNVRNGDEVAKQVLEKWVDQLTTGLQSLVHMFNPEMIVIGGGISAQGDFLLSYIRDSLFKKIMPNHQRNLSIKMAEYENKANLLGAIKHFIVE